MPDKSIGALWEKEKNGKKYMTGHIMINDISVNVVIFPNKYKEGVDKRPDWKVYVSTPKEQEGVPF